MPSKLVPHSEPSTDPKQVVEEIRRLKFGIGASLTGEARQVVDNMKLMCQGLLSTVAEDLNSKDSHFILELVQNADDNDYASGIIPSLSFTADPNRLVVVNNEIGFLSANVRALCSAGESSKKHKTGYIGEKGIGFKSVFKVTDAPEVHSNGFHFKFDRTDPTDLLGYVVPHWKDANLPVDDSATTLVLPARQEKPFSQDLLQDLDATLLLFLEKLRQLEVKSPGKAVRYSREDRGSITTLNTKSSFDSSAVQCKYFRASTKCDMSFLREPKRNRITETALVLAFPLTEEGAAAPDPASPIYAFLPIRDFGFPFCIQADFVLTSSREGVHENLPWNITLRDQIAGAFVAAIEAFKSQPRLADTYLRYLPETTAVHDPFFNVVVGQIVEALAEAECIRVETGRWRKPAQVLVASEEFRALFSSEDALNLFGAEYASKTFEASREQLVRIGCRELLVTDVVKLFVSHPQWLTSRPVEWKARFYAYLAKPGRPASYLKYLMSVACLPVAGGRFVSPESGTIFYPLSKGKKFAFEHELTLLDEDIYEAALEQSASVRELFDSLNVKQDNPYEFIHSHILKRHAQRPLTSDLEALVGHVRYIRDKLDSYLTLAAAKGQQESAALGALRTGLLLGTKLRKDRWSFASPATLYLGTEYRPDFDIEAMLGDQIDPVRLVSDAYMGANTAGRSAEETDKEKEDWCRFFFSIGVNEAPLLDKTSSATNCSPELKALLESGERKVRRTTLECLDRHWSKYQSSLTFVLKDRRGLHEYDTPFKSALRDTQAPTRRRATVKLSQSYVNSEELRGILGNNAVFIDAELKNSKFLDAAGITYKLDAAACIKRLDQMRQNLVHAKSEVVTIYRHLTLFWTSERGVIEAAFSSQPLILISGRWLHKRDVCWKGTNVRFLDAQNPPLERPYSEHLTFFTKQLSVPYELPLTKWVAALSALLEIEEMDERRSVASTIYRRLSRELGAHPTVEPDWLARFDIESLLLDHRGSLVAKSTTLYANDDPQLAALFTDELAISFLGVAPESLPSTEHLISRLGVQRLSTAARIRPLEGVIGKPNQKLTLKVQDVFNCIARVVYTQSHERFEAAIRDGLFNQLRNLRIQVVPVLELEVSLGNATRTTAGDAATRDGQLLLREGAPGHVDHVALEIQRILRLPQSQGAIINVLLRTTDTQDAEDFLAVNNISRLPVEEQALLDGVQSPQLEVFEEDTAQHDDLSAADPQLIDAPEVDSVEEQSLNISQSPRTSSDHSQTRPPDAEESETSLRLKGTAPLPSAADEVPKQPTEPKRLHQLEPAHPDGAVANNKLTRTPAPGSMETLPSRARHQRSQDDAARRFERSTFGRLLSYVEQADDDARVADEEEQDPEVNRRKKIVERAAVDHFMAVASGSWKQVHVMENPNNPGFDIRAVSHDGVEEFIEVKGLSQAWTEIGVALTPTELLKAQTERERYWLCVVEYADDESRRQLYLVNNPFGVAQQFRFDKGWKAKATAVATQPTRPAEGLFVTIVGEGRARIVAIKGSGQLVRLDLQFEDGHTRLGKLFEPNTMSLSVD